MPFLYNLGTHGAGTAPQGRPELGQGARSLRPTPISHWMQVGLGRHDLRQGSVF